MESTLNRPKDKNAAWKAQLKAAQGTGFIPTEPPRMPVEPFQDVVWAWNGFWRLSNCRPVGFNGLCRIPMAEIEAYCRLNEYDFGRRNEFLYYVEQLDNAYMEYIERKREEAERLRASQSSELGGNRRKSSRGLARR